MPPNSIAAVVLTRNRLALLQRCMAALRAQTRPLDAIIVVDNGSTDGTREWLAGESDVRVIQQENLGCAGGFYTGMKAGYDQGYDWLWCQDDDGCPAPDCLQQLTEINHPNLWYRAPLVIDEENHARLAFGLRLPEVLPFGMKVAQDRPLLTTRAEAVAAATGGLIVGAACPYNGILIHHRVFEAIGFPLREIFLFGDEVEFTCRACRAGFVATTCVRALYFHHADRMAAQQFRFLGRTLSISHIGTPQVSFAMLDYLVVRNQAYVYRVYYGWWRAMKHTARYAVFYLSQRRFAAACAAFRAGLAGMFGALNGHKKFFTRKQ